MAEAVLAAVAYVGGWGNAIAIAASVASVGMSIYAASQAQKGQQSSSAERKQVLRSSNAPKTLVYGESRSSGLLVFAQEQAGEQESDEEEQLTLVIAVAGTEIESITDLRLDEQYLSDVAEYVTFQAYPQGRETCDPYLLQKCPDWRENMVGKGVAWFRVTLKHDKEIKVFPSGIPQLTVHKKGRRVFDPRDGRTKYSANAALVIRDYLIMKGWSKDRLLDDLFKQAANICDEYVQNADGTTSARYELHCEINDDEKPLDVLEKMLSCCGGEWVRIGGKLGIKVGAYYGVPTIEITEDDIIGDSITIQPEQERQDSFNVVRGKYVSPVQDKYLESDYPEVRVAEWVKEDGEELVMNIDYPYVTNVYQAQRLADIALNRQRKALTLSLQCNYKAFSAVNGTLVYLSLEQLGMSKKEFVVTDWSFSAEEGVSLTLRYNSASFYDDIIGNAPAIPPIIDIPTGSIPSPSRLQFAPYVVNDIISGFVSWEYSLFNIDAFSVSVKGSNGKTVFATTVDGTQRGCEIIGLGADSYVVEVRARNAINVSPAATLSFVIGSPSVPDEVVVTPLTQALHIAPRHNRPQPIGNVFEFYRVSKSDYDNNVTPKGQPNARGDNWTDVGLQASQEYYYMVRAANSFDKSAFVKAKGTATGIDESLLPEIPEFDLTGKVGWTSLDEYLTKDLKKYGTDIQDNLKALTAANQKIEGLSGDLSEAEQLINDKSKVFQQDSAPAIPPAKAGDIWIKTKDKTTYVLNGSNKWEATTNVAFESMWGVKTSNGVAQAGFGIVAGYDPQGKPQSKFVISADVFQLLAKDGDDPILDSPFTVVDGKVYIKSGYINELKSVNIQSSTMTAGAITGANIQSANYTPNQKGYALKASNDPSLDGFAEFNNIVARGDIYAKSLTFVTEDAIPSEIKNSNITAESIGAETPIGAQEKANAAAESVKEIANNANSTANSAMDTVNNLPKGDTGILPRSIYTVASGAGGWQATVKPGSVEADGYNAYLEFGARDCYNYEAKFQAVDGEILYFGFWVYTKDTSHDVWFGFSYVTPENATTWRTVARANAGNDWAWVTGSTIMPAHKGLFTPWLVIDAVSDFGRARVNNLIISRQPLSNFVYPNQNKIQIKSSNYSAGTAGWAIDANGNAEFNNSVFRGQIYANQGWLNNVTIKENCKVLGKISANQIEGDVVDMIDVGANQSVVVPAVNWRRKVKLIPVALSATAYGAESASVTASYSINSTSRQVTAAARNSSSDYALLSGVIVSIPAGQTITLKYGIKHSGRGYGYDATATFLVSMAK